MRFQRMLELEVRGLSEYEALFEECKRQYRDETELQARLKKMITDEKKHVKLVEQLLKIVGQQKS